MLTVFFFSFLSSGCGGPSSEEGPSADPVGNHGDFVIPMEMRDGNLIIGDGSGAAVANIAGHTVEVRNGDTGCFAGGDVAKCWIRVINRDTDEYMANVWFKLGHCTTCLTAVLDNADALLGDTIHPMTQLDGNLGAVSPINGGEFAVVEDGDYHFPWPYNPHGAPWHTIPQGYKKPFQILHPSCGARSILWDFGGQTSSYRFYTALTAEYFPWKPWGPDGIPGTTADNDRRYDSVNRTTAYVMVTDLADKLSAVNKSWYRIGSYARSNVLSGWNAVGSGRATLVDRQYFAVNVAVEFPDRLEQQVVGTSVGFTNYEYYMQFAYLLHFDPKTVRRVTANGKTAAGTVFSRGVTEICAVGSCGNPALETYRGYEDPTGNTGYGWGYILTYAPILIQEFSWLSYGSIYQTLNGDQVKVGINSAVPANFGHKGRAKINMAAATIANPATAVIQDGVDPAPDLPLAMYMFQVKLKGSGQLSGRGSDFWIDAFSGFTSYQFGYTNGTLDPSGFFGGSNDWFGYCWPMQAGKINNQDQGCNTALPPSAYIIYGSNENSNPAIHHSGWAVPLYGAFQNWSAYICVQ